LDNYQIFYNIAPLYLLVILGWIGGRFLKIDKNQVAIISIYLLTPVVMSTSVAQMSFSPYLLFLPIILFSIATLVTFITAFICKNKFVPEEVNLMAATSGMTNCGYFGIPLAASVLPAEWLGGYILAIQGFVFHESLIALYLLFRTQLSPLKSLLKLFKMPAIWGVIIGIIFSLFSINFPESIIKLSDHIKSGYIVLGLMLLGIALSEIKHFSLDLRFLFVAYGLRTVLWTIFCYITCFIGSNFLFWNEEINKIFLVIAVLPVATNSLAYASILKLLPEKIVILVLISTLLSMVSFSLLAQIWFF
jgi:malate permease and related proteins